MISKQTVKFSLCVLFLLLGGGMTTAQVSADLDTVDESDFAELAELMRFLRSEQKEALFVPVAKLQLAYLTDAASRVETSDPDRALEIRRFARGVAYNIASFTWPGWGDSVEPISDARQKLGLAAAERTLELAEKIEEITPNALWILGAHQLNARQFEEAISSFERAEKLARNDFYRAMHVAWQELTNVAAVGDGTGLQNLDETITNLRNADFEDAEFFADQLTTARRIYIENAQH